MTEPINQGPILIFGEVLVDQFPDGQRILGGAPFNVAWHLTGLGAKVQLVSAVGDDPDGETIRAAMSAWGMDAGRLQTRRTHRTGAVSVTFQDGQPGYEILEQRAFDAIETLPIDPAECALLYHGTLALREPPSRSALSALKRETNAPVFMDVNLRDPWWERSSVLRHADDATWVKLNDEELRRLCTGNGDIESLAHRFLKTHGLEGVIVTRGAEGAFAIGSDGGRFSASPDAAVTVIDTVGAGDGFAAVMLLGIQRGWPIVRSLNRAQEFAALIVQNRGAILNDADTYASLAAIWQQ
jgi:fructokinase